MRTKSLGLTSGFYKKFRSSLFDFYEIKSLGLTSGFLWNEIFI